MISMLAQSGLQSKFSKLKSHWTSAIVVEHIVARSNKLMQLGLWASATKARLSYYRFVLWNFALYLQWSAQFLYLLLYMIKEVCVFLSPYCWGILKSDFTHMIFFLHANVKETLFLFFILIAVCKETNWSLLWAMKMI